MEKKRILYYAKILAHSSKELASLAEPLARVKRMDLKAHDEMSFRFWEKVRRDIKREGLNKPEICQKLHIYADGLSAQLYCCKACLEKTGQQQYMDEIESNKIRCSACGRTVQVSMKEALMKLVNDLIEAELPQYLLIEKLMERGAEIHGTESQQLLVAEHHMWSNAARGARVDPQEAATLLQKRDEFIARRINETLPQNEIGILFIGKRHRVDKELQKLPDIRVIYL